MADAMHYWSFDIESQLPRVPLEIIREAASPLASMTSGLVEAQVVSVSEEAGFITHRLRIVAPTIRFHLGLATFRHRVLAVYPVFAIFHNRDLVPYRPAKETTSFILPKAIYESLPREEIRNPPGEELGDEESLKNWLRSLLSSEYTTALVKGLIATLRSADGQPLETMDDD
jgi:hypothetical protein